MQTAVEKTVDGIEMGVLEDGTAFLTGRSLAKLCGVAHSSIDLPTNTWGNGDRVSKMAQFLVSKGVNRPQLYIPTVRNGQPVHAYPDDICAVVIEYFARVSRTPTPQAMETLGRIATAGLRLFIYGSVGYTAGQNYWRQFHDRLLLNPPPDDYFGVFHELSAMVLKSIRGGLLVDSHTVPDISVGMTWSKHWVANGYDAIHGPRIQIPHSYPSYFPQSYANGSIHAWAYPDDALPVFRRWLRTVYIPTLFPKYLGTKEKNGALRPGGSTKILQALGAPTAPPPASPASRPLFGTARRP